MKQIAIILSKFMYYYLLDHMNTTYYFAIQELKKEIDEIVNKL